MPGMRMSRKAMSGLCCSPSATASTPFAASATMRSSGQTGGQAGAQQVAHRRFVVGDHGGQGHAVSIIL
jgi:hypothetical protein